MVKPAKKRISNTPRRDDIAARTKTDVGGGPPSWAVAAILALLIGVVYGRVLHAPFIFDDQGSVLENRSIVSLWPLVGTSAQPGPLNPSPQSPPAGRPL